MKKTTILFISHHHYDPIHAPHHIGGMQRVSYQLLTELKQHPLLDVNTHVFYPPKRFYGIYLICFYLKLLLQLTQIVKRKNIDLICYSSMVTAAIGGLLGDRLTCKQVTICHGLDVVKPIGIYQRFILPKIFMNIDTIVTISKAVKSACVTRGCPRKKAVIIPNGLSSSWIHYTVDRAQAKRDIIKEVPELNQNSQWLLTVGRIIPRKGQFWFIQNVLPLLPDHFKYVLIGEGPDVHRIKKWLAKSHHSDKVVMLGAIQMANPLLKKLYQTADVFIMPNQPLKNDLEGFGVVMLEAGCMGTPVVGSATDGIEDVITSEAFGKLVDPKDVNQFKEYIIRYANQPLSIPAIESLKTTYSWSKIANDYSVLFKKLID